MLMLRHWCRQWWPRPFSMMMTSSNGNIFRVTGHLCGEFTGPGEFPTQRPVTRSFDVFIDLRLNKRLSKHSRGWWFETRSRPLWHHRNVYGWTRPCWAIDRKRSRIRVRSGMWTELAPNGLMISIYLEIFHLTVNDSLLTKFGYVSGKECYIYSSGYNIINASKPRGCTSVGSTARVWFHSTIYSPLRSDLNSGCARSVRYSSTFTKYWKWSNLVGD